ncbi:HNH endonuclease [Streptomyces sp. NPDC048209]|jgi:5-methylcytosine-specific restriction endonuclease McrA|uniref:HNH endonuclease n=1 Tax=Streptomyces sp. NPDC048209 TaxID=3156689 RepID=UPI0034203F7D
MTNRRRVQCGQVDCRRRFNAERGLVWQTAHKAQAGRWYHRNYAEQQRAYYRRIYQQQGSWRHRHPGKAAAYDARRRALLQQARTAETFAPSEVHSRDRWTCQLCLLPIDPSIAWPDTMSASIDHVIPLSRGGAHSMANVQSAHLGCNCSKGTKLMIEVIRDLRSRSKA